MPSSLELEKQRKITPALQIGIGILVVVVLVIVRVATVTPANAALRTSAPTTVKLSGHAPKPAWPLEGQAAFKVLQLGSLGSSGGDTPIPTASLAKVMTAYVILRQHPLSGNRQGFTVTITKQEAAAEKQDLAEDQSVVAVAAGEKLTERQMLEALLIPSGDNIARILGAYDAGSVAAFVTKMNRTARALGMRHTTYTDPSGFDPSTVSTASDQMKVFERAIRYRVFREVVEMPSATLPVAGTVTNYNPLVDYGYYGKTGSDSAAEGCLAFYHYVTVAGRRITEVGVVMGQGAGSDTSVILGAAGDASQALADSVTPSIRTRTVLAAGAKVIEATSASGDKVSGVTTDALRVISWGGRSEQLAITHAKVSTSLNKGQRLGAVTLSGPLPIPRGGAATTSVNAATALPAPGLGWRLAHIL